MRLEWLELLCCPDDGSAPLILRPTRTTPSGAIVEGGLECPGGMVCTDVNVGNNVTRSFCY